MNTKYNGILLVAVAVATASLVVFTARTNGRRVVRGPLCALAIITSVALLVYLPWLLHVEGQIGYTRLLEHHRGYLGTLAEWPRNLVSLASSHLYLTGWWGRLSLAAGLGASMFVQPGCLKRMVRSSALGALAVAGAVGIACGDVVGWVAGPAVLAAWVPRRSFQSRLHLAWLLLLLAVTPLYRPYARLMVPLAVGGWIAAAAVIGRLSQAVVCENRPPSRPGRQVWLLPVAAGCLAVSLPIAWWTWPVRVGEGRTLAAACSDAAASLPSSLPVFAFLRPPALYYLGGQANLRVVGGLEAVLQADRSAYLLLDRPLLRDNPNAGRSLRMASRQGRCRVIGRWDYLPGPATLLDDWGSELWSRPRHRAIAREYQLLLLRVQGRTTGR